MSKKFEHLLSRTSLAYKLRNIIDLDGATFNAVMIDITLSKLQNGKAAKGTHSECTSHTL